MTLFMLDPESRQSSRGSAHASGVAIAAIGIKHFGARKEAGQALLQLGPLADKGAWLMANQNDVGVKAAGVQLLGEVGSAR